MSVCEEMIRIELRTSKMLRPGSQNKDDSLRIIRSSRASIEFDALIDRIVQELAWKDFNRTLTMPNKA